MITLNIDDKNIEEVFFNEFNNDKEKLIDFIKNNLIKLKTDHTDNEDLDFQNLQLSSMNKTWDNDIDKAWDEV